MNILLIGASGTIGSAIDDALSHDHDLVRVGRTSGDVQADLSEPDSIQALYETVVDVDAVVSAAGNAAFNPLTELTDEDFELSLSSKLMGQVNLVRHGLPHINTDANPSFTLVTGILSNNPIPGSAAISMVNCGVEGFMRGAALEAPDGIRVNAVSPPWVSETLEEMGEDPSDGLPAATVAQAFVDSVEGDMNGKVIDARDYA
jgi:NAD(P)-dependent dehydrogenase (short-subunit alcohol dehydrogenase family)